MAQLRPVASSLGMDEGRVSLREAVATDMVMVWERVHKNLGRVRGAQ
jgi:hypothetical protein